MFHHDAAMWIGPCSSVRMLLQHNALPALRQLLLKLVFLI